MDASRNRRDGFSLLEVMIVVMILSVGLVIMLGNIFTLDKAHAGNKELAKVQELMQVLAERIEGGTWNNLGQIDQPWSWSRRDPVTTPAFAALDPVTSPNNPPMTEVAPDANNNLIALGLISAVSNTRDAGNAGIEAAGTKGGSGLQNLQVFVEYYSMDIMDDPNLRNDPKTVRFNWRYPRDSAVFDLRSLSTATRASSAIIVRIVVRWDQSSGGSGYQELILARRQ